MPESTEDLRAKLNAETGRMTWNELARFFARGVVIRVSSELDLVEVAARIAGDDKAALQVWTSTGQVARAGTDEAQAWNDRQAVFWAVVTAPWVLVQEITQ